MSETKKRAPMLHELLAALGDAEARSNMVQQEATDTFTKRPNHFLGAHRTLRMFADADKHLEESHIEHQEITTTIRAKLRYIQRDIARWWDAFLQKEATNQEAKADLVVDDTVIAKDLPAAFFLGMEKELKSLRKCYENIPTLQPGIKWEKDPTLAAADNSKGVYRNMNPDKKLKTKQTIGHKILVPQDEHHPAQVEKWTEQDPVGEFTVEVVSGMITPAEKSIMLQRITKLIAAVKRSRMRANSQEIKKLAIGKALFEYINASGDVENDEE